MKNSLLPSLPELAHTCLNLRPDFSLGADRLVPVMPPAMVGLRPWRVIGIFQTPDDNVVELMVDGRVLGASVHGDSEPVSQPYVITGRLEGRATCAYRVADGFMVLTDRCMYHIVYDANGILRAETPVDASAYPTLVTLVTSETTVQAAVEGFKLSGSYGPTVVTLAPDDASRLDKAVIGAYSRASATAVADGGFVAPVFVRYRLIDSHNRLLMESVPKLHVPTGRHDYGATVSLSADLTGGRVMPGAIPLPLYRLSIQLPAADGSVAQRRIARIEVQLTPQIHRVDPSLGVINRLGYAASGDSLTVTLPGSDAALADRVRRAMGRLDSLFETVAVIDNPFDGSQEVRTVAIPARVMTLDREIAALGRVVSADDSTWLSRCRPPHSVTAAVGVGQGDATLLGNLSVSLYDGAPVAHYLNSGSGAGAVETVATVSFGTERRAVAASLWMSGYRQAVFSPVIAYPDPEATSIELTMRDSEGTVSSATFRLTRCGRYACYIDPGVKPVTLGPADDYEVPQAFGQTVRYPGHLISYSSMAPLADIAGLKAGHGRINAIHPVARPSSSAWQSSRSRFLIMGDDGIFSMAMNGHTPVTPVLLDPRPVAGPGSVATATGHERRVFVLAGRDLVAVDGNSVRTLATRTGASMLAWVAAHGELLAISTPMDGVSPALVYRPDCGGWSMRQLPPVSAVYYNPARARVTSEACILYTSDAADEL